MGILRGWTLTSDLPPHQPPPQREDTSLMLHSELYLHFSSKHPFPILSTGSRDLLSVSDLLNLDLSWLVSLWLTLCFVQAHVCTALWFIKSTEKGLLSFKLCRYSFIHFGPVPDLIRTRCALGDGTSFVIFSVTYSMISTTWPWKQHKRWHSLSAVRLIGDVNYAGYLIGQMVSE